MFKPLLKYLIVPVAVIVIAACIMGSAKVTADSAHTFISSYYSKALQLKQRSEAYNKDLTTNFHNFPGDNWHDYVDFWQDQRAADINSVVPVPGNPMEFTVNVAFRPKSGKSFDESADFWFVCNGLMSNLIARFPSIGCPVSSLQIDNKALVSEGP